MTRLSVTFEGLELSHLHHLEDKNLGGPSSQVQLLQRFIPNKTKFIKTIDSRFTFANCFTKLTNSTDNISMNIIHWRLACLVSNYMKRKTLIQSTFCWAELVRFVTNTFGIYKPINLLINVVYLIPIELRLKEFGSI